MEVDVTDSAIGCYEILGRLLLYPDESFPERLAACRRQLANADAKAASEVERFAAGVEGLSLERLQEIFTQTFDLNPICSLEVGWQLFGEEYSRGAFLVAMRCQLREKGIEESIELPDHLTHILPLLDRMEDRERVYFNDKYLQPALTKMLKAFESKQTPYEHLLRACEGMLPRGEASKSSEVAHG